MRAFVTYARMALCVLLCLCMTVPTVFAAGDSGAFLAAVDEACETVNYEDRVDAVAYARSLYDASMAEEAGIAEALEKLETCEASLRAVRVAADAFIAAIARATQAHEAGEYAETVSALSDAEDVYEAAIALPGYPGVPAAEYERKRIREELFEPEQASIAYIAAATAIGSCTTYEEVRAQWISMRTLSSELIPDYPGVAEAEKIFRETEAYLSDCEQKANDFIAAVQNAPGAEQYAKELVRLIAMRETVDFTVDGVRTANSTLNYLIREYNKSVREANEAADAATSLGMTLGMTPGGRNLSQNVFELIK